MDHAPNSDTFQSHYFSRFVRVDVYAKMRAERPQKELLKQATSHGSSIDTRRPITLDSNDYIDAHPQYSSLKKQHQQLLKGSPERDEAGKRLRALREKLREEALEKHRHDWSRKQAVEDIRGQLEGRGFASQDARNLARTLRPMSDAQVNMLEALEAPLVNDLSAQFERRNKAIRAVMTYCHMEEPMSMSNRMLAGKPPQPQPEMEMKLAPLELARQIRKSVFGKVGDVLRCFICVAKALTLLPGDPSVDEHLRLYANHSSLVRHFERQHLKSIAVNAVGECPICSPAVALENKMHLQNHAEVPHGIRTKRPSPKRPRGRV